MVLLLVPRGKVLLLERYFAYRIAKMFPEFMSKIFKWLVYSGSRLTPSTQK